MDPSSAQIWRLWRQAAEQPEVDAELRGIYAEVSRQIQAKGPQCWASGRCCHFETYGHRLYVTGLEIAWVLRHAPQTAPLPGMNQKQDGCVYQQGHLCGIHAHRPLGCRLFFCQRGTDSWQHQLHEQMLGELRRLHERQKMPYRYLEWRAGLVEAWRRGLVREHPAGG